MNGFRQQRNSDCAAGAGRRVGQAHVLNPGIGVIGRKRSVDGARGIGGFGHDDRRLGILENAGQIRLQIGQVEGRLWRRGGDNVDLHDGPDVGTVARLRGHGAARGAQIRGARVVVEAHVVARDRRRRVVVEDQRGADRNVGEVGDDVGALSGPQE